MNKKIPIWAQQIKPVKGKVFRHVNTSNDKTLYWNSPNGAVAISEIHCNKKGKIKVYIAGGVSMFAAAKFNDLFYFE